jgi:hypothetical protein
MIVCFGEYVKLVQRDPKGFGNPSGLPIFDKWA